ncbi:orotate phosphoribosyltransferase [Paenibacillus sp.]|uniref:orotate phosphoribosyltransferase n=1 Tax=Paenibacillus sp. TaxID=58172 RepID=UPI002D73ACB1|nr:orotate phosphoribosyltransferase [Paenibacillus sp.]HZG58653.1 orotate phosphoribosyltransferase [Paenibacillus sp.]
MTTIALEQRIAEALLSIGAVSLRPQQPFTWTSGIKSPIYCDNRLTMSHPSVRDMIAEGFATLVREKYPQADMIAGTATAGIPHAAWVAQKLNLPMIYVRDKAKGHGKQNLIEGQLEAGRKVVVIEDLISTGGSSIKAAQAVNEAGGEALAVLAIFSYQFEKADAAFAAAGVPLATLSNYTALIETALREHRIRPEDVAALSAWRLQPDTYYA